jgi:hypothetical protein
MTRLPRTTAALGAAVVLTLLVPWGSVGEPQPRDDRASSDRVDGGGHVDPAVAPDAASPSPTAAAAPREAAEVPSSVPVPPDPGALSGADRPAASVAAAVAAHTTSPEGFRVAGGRGPVVGAAGPLMTWTVEVEPATGWSLGRVLPVVARALQDPRRGWAAAGERRLRRVDDPLAADVRVVLAAPDTVDRLCAASGVETLGIYSCWDGQRAMLNVTRWEHGATDVASLATYRTYLVNHEVGHAFGGDHVDCPAPGGLAPVMMQQTKTTGACRPNGWPHP